jgi:hypothetical protein
MKLGWAFFGLAVVVTIAYGLNRGIYLGSATYPSENSFAPGTPWFVKNCRYLFPDGIHRTYANGARTMEEASNGICPFFER